MSEAHLIDFHAPPVFNDCLIVKSGDVPGVDEHGRRWQRKPTEKTLEWCREKIPGFRTSEAMARRAGRLP